MTRKIVEYYNNYPLDFIEQASPLYHYTSFDGFKSIITTGKLRFTNRLFLNDYSEGAYVLTLCINQADFLFEKDDTFKQRFLEKCNERLATTGTDPFQFYQCSFTTDGDNLPMWNYYAGNGGINLEFNGEIVCDHYAKKCGNKATVFNCGLIVYEEGKQLKIIKKMILDFWEKSTAENREEVIKLLIKKLMYAGIFFKSKSYETEKEYRIAFELFSKDGMFNDFQTQYAQYKIDVMYAHGLIVPFVDVLFERYALKSLTVPNLVTEKERQALKLFLMANGYDSVEKIKMSKITKRF